MTPTSPRRRRQLLSAVALTGGACLIAGPATAADQPRAYSALASAYAFDATVSNPSIPLSLVVEAAGPVAQAAQDNLPTSDAFASFPYPGDTAANALPTAASLFHIPVPPYPAIAKTTINDEDPRRVSYPGVELVAQSGDRVTQATADGGSSGFGGRAFARVVYASSQAVTSTAEGGFDALRVGDYLTVSGASSKAKVSVDEYGKVTRSTSLSFARIAMPGLKYTLPKTVGGYTPLPNPIPGAPAPALDLPVVPVPWGGQTLPNPDIGFRDGYFTVQLPGLGTTEFAVPAQSVLDAFQAVGVTMTYQKPYMKDGTVIGAGLTIKTAVPAPPDNPGYNGLTDVELSLGRVIAKVAAGKVGSPSPPITVLPGIDLPVTPGADPGGSGTVTSPVVPVSDPGSLGQPTDVGGQAPTVAGGDQSAGGPTAFNGSPVRSLLPTPTSWIYPLFVVLALTGFGAVSILRLVGVRSR